MCTSHEHGREACFVEHLVMEVYHVHLVTLRELCWFFILNVNNLMLVDPTHAVTVAIDMHLNVIEERMSRVKMSFTQLTRSRTIRSMVSQKTIFKNKVHFKN